MKNAEDISRGTVKCDFESEMRPRILSLQVKLITENVINSESIFLKSILELLISDLQRIIEIRARAS